MNTTRADTFIHELPLRVLPAQERELNVRFDCARQLYNACLGEALRRLRLMRESRRYRKARSMKRGRERSSEFRKLDARFGFREYDLHAYATKTKNACHIGDHLDAHTTQKLASRAFAAAREYAFGKRGRPRFKGRGRGLHSLEGKTNASGIKWRDAAVHWGGLVLPAIPDVKDKWGVQAHALACRVKYVRLVRRMLRGRVRWYAQLVLEGTPLWKEKNQVGTDVVGLDLGPSTIACVGEDTAFLEAFCPEIERDESAIRRIRRRMDRSRRATNPDHYNPDRTPKKDVRSKVRSNRYIRLQNKLAEFERREAVTRKTAHGRLANRIIAIGNIVKTEKISYRAWQRSFGRSVAKRAPGLFVSMLRRKAENAGGELMEFSTRATKLSQTCMCGAVHKKPLSQRRHECPVCGAAAQRDLFSAFLARFVASERDEVYVDVRRAREAWQGSELLLSRTTSALQHQTAIACPMSLERHKGSGGEVLASFGLTARSRSRSSVEENLGATNAADDVACPIRQCESHGEAVPLCS